MTNDPTLQEVKDQLEVATELIKALCEQVRSLETERNFWKACSESYEKRIKLFKEQNDDSTA